MSMSVSGYVSMFMPWKLSVEKVQKNSHMNKNMNTENIMDIDTDTNI
jgi:hypothetical protein